jgi:hypothetical protein
VEREVAKSNKNAGELNTCIVIGPDVELSSLFGMIGVLLAITLL